MAGSLLDRLRLAAWQHPAGPHEVAGVAVGDLLQVVLVLLLGLPERAGRGYLRDDLAGPQARRVNVGDGVLGDGLLLLAGVEDRRAVAAAHVVALPVVRRRVVDLEEELQQLPERDHVGVEDDLDRLRVIAVIPVRGVRGVAARVSDAGGDHPRTLPKQLLGAPEAAAGEDRLLGGHRVPLSVSSTALRTRRPLPVFPLSRAGRRTGPRCRPRTEAVRGP